MLGRVLFSAVVFCGIAVPAWAVEGAGDGSGAGDKQRGAAYALAMCASCHSVSEDEAASPNPAAKPFRSVKLADIPGGLVSWFNTDHPNTSRILKDTQGEDIGAFIASIAK